MTQKTEFILSARDETQAAFKSATAGLGALKSKADGFVANSVAGLSGGLAAGLLGVGFTAQIKAAINDLDKMDEAAERIGVTTEALSGLAYAGKMGGLELDDMTGALTKLSVKMNDAFTGEKSAVALFKDLGISVKDSSGQLKSADKVFAEVADRFASFEDGAAKTALAVDLVGKSGAKLVPTFNQGAAGLEAMTKEAKALGAIYDSKLAKQAADFNDNLDKLAILASSAGKSIASEIIPSLNKLTLEFLAAQKAGMGFWESLVGIGLSDPTKSAGQQINSLTSEIDKLKAARDAAMKSNVTDGGGIDTSGMESDIAKLQRRREYFKSLQLSAALEGADANYGNEGRGAKGGGKEKIVRTPSDGPTPPKGAKQLDAAEALLKTLDKKIAVSALDLTTTEKLTAAEKEYAGVQQEMASGALKATASQRALIDGKYEYLIAADKELENQKLYADALEKANQSMVEHRQAMLSAISTAEEQALVYGLSESQLSAVAQARLADALAIAQANGASEDAVKYLEEEIRLRGLLTDALIKGDQKRLEQTAETTDEMSEFAKSAAKNMQSSFADFLFDPFANGTKSMGENFANSLKRMAAEAASAKIMNALVGDGKSEKGLVGSIDWSKLFSGFGSSSSGATGLASLQSSGVLASFAVGTDYVPRDMIAQIHKGERIVPAKFNPANGGGAVSVQINNYSGQSVQQKEVPDGRGGRRIEVTVGDMVAAEMRRPGSAANKALSQPRMVSR